MNRRQRTRLRSAHGQAMVELAIALGVLLLIILGAVDAIQIMMTQYTVNQATRAAAHQSALIGGPGTVALNNAPVSSAGGPVAQAARLILDGGMTTQSSKARITVTCAPSPCRRYSAITVRLTYQDDLWIPAGPFKDVRADKSSTRAAEQDQQSTTGGGPGSVPGGPTATPRPPKPTPFCKPGKPGCPIGPPPNN